MTNRLYFGDNLEVMREYVADASVDLVYLDPPFNSKAEYNVVFESAGEAGATAQAGAFVDAWIWDRESEFCYDEVMRSGGAVASMLQALRGAMGPTPLMAYLAMMTPRLVEMKRALREHGSLYLHCDSSASHYLKLILDQIFGLSNFRNEITWKRTNTHNDSKSWSRVSDKLLFYSSGKQIIWNTPRERFSEDYVQSKYRHDDGDGRLYQLGDMTSPSPRPNMMYEWQGFPFPARGWRYSVETMARLHEEGRIWYPQAKDGTPDYSKRPRLKRYLDEMAGPIMGDVWTDISPLNSQATERLGYPTQKPTALLERIIAASTDKGMTVLDPFCGCGTTIEAAEDLERNWIGIDVAIHAVKVIETRLADRIEGEVSYSIQGIPRDYASAERLAERDKYQFEWWANYLFNPFSVREKKKGGDRGIDGEIFFPNGPGRPYGKILTSVKGGDKLNPGMIRDFKGVLDREKAEMGLFICLRQPTAGMKSEAAQAGFADIVHGRMPRLQIVSIEDYFEGRMPQLPPLPLPSTSSSPARRRQAAAKVSKPSSQGELLFTFTDEQLDPAYIPKPAKGEERHVNPVFKAG